MARYRSRWLCALTLFVVSTLTTVFPLSPFTSLGHARSQLSPPQSQHAPISQAASRTFAETGKSVRGRFLQYWQEHRGLAQQGFPISEGLGEVSPIDGKTYTVQYFERAVFEYHPENQPPNDVLLSLLGVFLYQQKYPNGAPGQVVNSSAGSMLFSQTGHRVGGGFLDYWKLHGGLAQQGYPISDEFSEVSDLNGNTYTVQYFQRAEFEYHQENPPSTRILLSQLGTFRYRANYPAGSTSLPPPVPVPPALPAPATPTPVPTQRSQPPAPTPVPQPTGRYVASASVSISNPTMNQHETVYERLMRGGRPVVGATMDTTWHYKTKDSYCSGVTDNTGTASCERSISHATPGYTVYIDVMFTTPDGQQVSTQTSFTPEYCALASLRRSTG